MTQNVVLPLWLVIVLALLAAWAALDRLLMPSVRWYLRRHTNRVLDEITTRLHIEIRPFQRTKRQVLIDRLMYDAQVQEAAQAFADEQRMPSDLVMRRIEQYAREIVPGFNAYVYFRVGYWLSRRIAGLLYRVRLGHVDQAGLQAVPSDASVVFVMNHRSNMDYILVAYLVAKRTALSYAVGEWARIWPLQTLIRAMGAYFVRRGSGDALYRRVLERYICMATAGGVPQAVYPEGGLTRDGKLRDPKLGLLDYMLRGFDPQGERDLVFLPVGINYDRTLEDRTLAGGANKHAELKRGLAAVLATMRFVLRNLRLMSRNRWFRLGYACVNFGSPVSLRKYVEQHRIDFSAMPREERYEKVAELGRTLMQRIGEVIPVLPVSVVATVFARSPHEAFSELELKARVHDLVLEFKRTGAHLYVPRQDQDYAITVGLRALTLRRFVKEHDGLFTAQPEQLPLLRYYANSIAHLLAPDANCIASDELVD